MEPSRRNAFILSLVLVAFGWVVGAGTVGLVWGIVVLVNR